MLASYLPPHIRISCTMTERPSLKREIDCEKRDLAIALDGRWFLASSMCNNLIQGRRFMRVILVSAVASALLVGISSLAVADELTNFGSDMKQELGSMASETKDDLKAEQEQMRDQFKAKQDELKTDTKTKKDQMKSEMKAKRDALKAERKDLKKTAKTKKAKAQKNAHETAESLVPSPH